MNTRPEAAQPHGADEVDRAPCRQGLRTTSSLRHRLVDEERTPTLDVLEDASRSLHTEVDVEAFATCNDSDQPLGELRRGLATTKTHFAVG
jgi:hypothetical protein